MEGDNGGDRFRCPTLSTEHVFHTSNVTQHLFRDLLRAVACRANLHSNSGKVCRSGLSLLDRDDRPAIHSLRARMRRRSAGRSSRSSLGAHPTLHLTSQNDQLMSEHRILRLKSALRLEWRCQNGKDEKQQPDHPTSLRDSIASSTKIGFSVHTGAIPNQELAELTV